MISKIGPLVEAGRPRRYSPVVLHLVGGLVGGAITGIIVGFATVVLVSLLPSSASALLAIILLVALLLAGLADLRLVPAKIRLIRQTPDSWTCAFGPSSASLTWGLDLGLAFTTKLPCKTLIVLPLFALASQNLLLAIATMATYGLVRSLVVAGTLIAVRGDYSGVCDGLLGRHEEMNLAIGFTGIMIAALLMTQMQ